MKKLVDRFSATAWPDLLAGELSYERQGRFSLLDLFLPGPKGRRRPQSVLKALILYSGITLRAWLRKTNDGRIFPHPSLPSGESASSKTAHKRCKPKFESLGDQHKRFSFTPVNPLPRKK